MIEITHSGMETCLFRLNPSSCQSADMFRMRQPFNISIAHRLEAVSGLLLALVVILAVKLWMQIQSYKYFSGPLHRKNFYVLI